MNFPDFDDLMILVAIVLISATVIIFFLDSPQIYFESAPAENSVAGPLEFEIISLSNPAGNNFGGSEFDAVSGNFVFKSTEDVVSYWGEDYSFSVPEINFSEKMLLLLFGGTSYHGGNSYVVNNVEETDSEIIVNAVAISPGVNCAITQSISFPHVAVLIHASEKQVVFNVVNSVSD